jgi:hypothetical protein
MDGRGSTIDNRLSSLLLGLGDDGIGEEGADEVGLCGFVVMCILTSWERTIRRIGSLHSLQSCIRCIRFSSTKVVGVAVMVGDGPFRFGEDTDGEVGDCRGSSKYHRLDVSWISAPTIFSPSSFPQTSNKLS